MYSLFVHFEAAERNEGTFTIERERFLEYTAESIATQLVSLSIEARQALCSWPCLLLAEGKAGEPVTLVKIENIDVGERDLRVRLAPTPNQPDLVNAALWKLRNSLDIGDFEFSRNHWAIKDNNLLGRLEAEGLRIDAAVTACFQHYPLPAPSRPELLQARDAISNWGHTEIDDLLLEAGIDDIKADWALGNRRDRANAIIRYALEHPAALTAEASLFSAFLVSRSQRGKEPPPSAPQLPGPPLSSPDPLDAVGVHEEPTREPEAVFVVHGQNSEARNAVTRFLSELGLRPVILHDQPNMGRHLLTKFIEEAELITFS